MLRPFVRAVLVSLFVSVVALLVSLLDIFGQNSDSARTSQAIFQLVTSSQYPKRPFSAREGQSDVRIVYINDDTAKNMPKFARWKGFPPTPDQQGEMIDFLLAPQFNIDSAGGVAEIEPAQILFLDFLYYGDGFSSPIEGQDRFAKLLATIAAKTKSETWRAWGGCDDSPIQKLACIVEAEGTPIILAKPVAFGEAKFTDIQNKLDEIAVLVPVTAASSDYPLTYEQKRPPGKQLDKHQPIYPFDISPAYAIYAARCFQMTKGCNEPSLVPFLQRARVLKRHSLVAKAEGGDLPQVPRTGLSVVWGSHYSSLQKEMDRKTGGALAPCREFSFLEGFFASAFGPIGPGSGSKQVCLYTVSATYDRLVTKINLHRGLLNQFLSGKIILVGAELRGGNDWVESPINGQVPGVQYHAMALDNLIERSLRGYRRQGGHWKGDWLEAGLLFVLTLIGLVTLMLRNGRHADTQAGQPFRASAYMPIYLGGLVVSLSTISLVVLIGVALQNTTTINWLAILGISTGVTLLESGEALIHDFSGSLARHATGRPIIGALLGFINLFDFSKVALRRVAPKPTDHGDSE